MQVHLSRMVNIMKYSQPALMLAKESKTVKVQEMKPQEADIDNVYLKLVEECSNLKAAIMKRDRDIEDEVANCENQPGQIKNI